MRGYFLRGVVLGSLTSALVLGASAALAGTGIGGVFNLGQSNTVNNTTSLTGSSSGSQLLVHNGAGLAAAFQSKAGSAPFSVNSSVQVALLNASLLGGHSSSYFLSSSGTAANASRLGGLPATVFYQSRATPVGNTLTTVDSSSSVGDWVSITIGADGLPIISYWDYGNGHLKVVHCTTVKCTSTDTPQTVDSSSNVGPYSSITIGADGLPIISYLDQGNGHLKVVHCTTVKCTSTDTPQTVDSSSNVGYFSSITIGADGLPIIGYLDGGNGHLKVVHCTTVKCTSTNTPQTVDSSSNVGYYSSITIGADGLPIISYQDYGNNHLEVVHCTTVNCTSTDTPQTVDSNSYVGYYISITIGADGLPIISYLDDGNGLRVVHCTTVNCTSTDTPQTVDSSSNVGLYISITIGADGLPIISYRDYGNGHLKVVHCTTVNCTSTDTPQTVDSSGNVGYYSAITIGADGLPIIGYFDGGNGHLKVAHCASVFCVPYFRRR
jgi:hypothetical protein